MTPLDIVFLGLSITSSWGNGHATTYRGMVRELVRRGHRVVFLERDVPWYAAHRDLPDPPWGSTHLYGDLADLRDRFGAAVRDADLVVVGSYVPQGVDVAEWTLSVARGRVAFYDIDTPVTLAKLARGDEEYIAAALIPRFDAYLSFSGGPALGVLERMYGSPCARAFHCSVDPEQYFPEKQPMRWEMGYLGTYGDDRQPILERLLLEPARRLPARRFAVAGALYPEAIAWPANVDRVEHIPPAQHRAFYNAQRFALNVTRADMIEAGWSPSVRLFEAAACGVPIVSDVWEGLEDFLEPGSEILLARTADDVAALLDGLSEEDRVQIGRRARRRILRNHTAAHRALELERIHAEISARRPVPHPMD